MEEDSKIFLDLQEKRRFKNQMEHLKRIGGLKLVQLRTGDILISGEKGVILIERKSVGDFAGSLSSGQLFKELKQMSDETKETIGKFKTDTVEILASLEHEQWLTFIKDLNEQGERREKWAKLMIPYSELSEEVKELDRVWARKVLETLANLPFFHIFVLVEGSILEVIRRDWQIKSLLSGLAMLPLSWKTNLIWLENKDLTPLLIESFADYVGKPKEPPQIYGSRPKRKMTSISEQQRFLIEGFAGIGGQTADRILENTGSPFNLFYDLQQGVKIRGLGPARTESMKKVIFSQYEPKKKKEKKE